MLLVTLIVLVLEVLKFESGEVNEERTQFDFVDGAVVRSSLSF